MRIVLSEIGLRQCPISKTYDAETATQENILEWERENCSDHNRRSANYEYFKEVL